MLYQCMLHKCKCQFVTCVNGVFTLAVWPYFLEFVGRFGIYMLYQCMLHKCKSWFLTSVKAVLTLAVRSHFFLEFLGRLRIYICYMEVC
jgi:hypothetical protein